MAARLVGSLPATFALPAGVGDTLVGVLALPVELSLQSVARGARGLAVGWNLLGILDILDAITLGMLMAARPSYPLVLILALGCHCPCCCTRFRFDSCAARRKPRTMHQPCRGPRAYA